VTAGAEDGAAVAEGETAAGDAAAEDGETVADGEMLAASVEDESAEEPLGDLADKGHVPDAEI
jgi:hypothetical protein